jgi:hypothetical protein
MGLARLLNWRSARESNPSHSMDSGAASPDASQTLRIPGHRRGFLAGAAPALQAIGKGSGRDPDWCVWPDSNGHCMRSQRIPSAYWGTDAWKTVAKSGLRLGGSGWIQTNAGLTPGRLRGGCRRSLGYWSVMNVGYLRDAPIKMAVAGFDNSFCPSQIRPTWVGAPREVRNWRTRWDSHPR